VDHAATAADRAEAREAASLLQQALSLLADRTADPRLFARITQPDDESE
jgi:hypothetical protein